MKAKRKPFDRRLTQAADSGSARSNWLSPTAKKPLEAWHIAVRGTIDLRVHHPEWYRRIGCISDSELDEGMKSLLMVGDQHKQAGVMQFDVGRFAINVIPDRWMVQTVTEANCDRLIEVAVEVFKHLQGISLTAYGINKTLILELKTKSAKQFLADQLLGSKLALQPGNADAFLAYAARHDDADTQIWFNQSTASEKWLVVDHNRHHPIDPPSRDVDLGSKLQQHAKADWITATNYRAKLALAIGEGEENGE